MPTSIKKSISIRLTSSGSDTDNFNVYESYTQSDNIIATGVSRASLLSGATFGINPDAIGYLIESTGPCNTVHTVTFPTTTTTTTTTLSFYSWPVQLGTNDTISCSTTPSLTQMCSTGNAYTTTVYTRYQNLGIGTKIYIDSALTTTAFAAGYRTIRTVLAFDPLSGIGIDDNYVYFLDSLTHNLSVIISDPVPIKCCGCSGLPNC
jgi:hypothetical protein